MISNNSSKKQWNENILIIGKGYIGSYLYNALEEYQRMIVSSADMNYHDNLTLNRFLLNNNISMVINCSGFTGRPNVDEGELKKEECWQLNVISPLMVNSVCVKLGLRYVHISSGCIYDGYDKQYIEEDKPNFGLFDYSSFYSKSKHAFELMSKHLNNKIIRIRMPITPDNNPRNYLTKIKNYDNIIDMVNSKTYIPDLCNFIKNLTNIDTVGFWRGQDIYNVVNPNALSTASIVNEMICYHYDNPNWKWLRLDELNITAPRSNCVLDGTKTNKIYKMMDEREMIKDALSQITKWSIV